MPRVKLELPEQFPFATEIPLRITDINYGGHLGNDALLSLLHEARVQFLRQYGFTEVDVDGRSIIMADVVIVYRSESFYGDVARIEMAVTDLQTHGCDFVYKVTNRGNGKEIARAKTGIVFFDYEKRKIVPAPQKFTDLFSADS
ncbi:MAG: thioesterase [Ignavibacteria bacterium]|nr:thioesterase [Ignavibacteria bacterium]